MPAASPNAVSLATASASSSSATRITAAAGPKISSRLMRIALVVPVHRIGER